MDKNRQISQIMESDANMNHLGTLTPVCKSKDCNHLQRRQQQRAISNAMIQIAVMYGEMQTSHGALTFTLQDKSLQHTPYWRFIDVLRGLRVVCVAGLQNPQILTAYWHEDTKRRVRK